MYFHAEVFDGGLGIPLLDQVIPLMKSKHVSSLSGSDDLVMQGLFAMPVWAAFLRSQLKPGSYAGTLINDKQSLRDTLAQTLHRSTDGCGLAASSQVPQQHLWLGELLHTLTEAAYIGAVKIRGNLMPHYYNSVTKMPESLKTS